MKKLLFTSLILILALVLGLASASAQTPEEGVILAKAVWGKPVAIDGILDEGWNNANTYVNERYVGNPDNDKIDAEWKIMYDDKYIYFFVNVTDPTLGDEEYEYCGPNYAALWTKNSIHIMLDLGYERDEFYDSNDFYFDVGCRGDYLCHTQDAWDYVEFEVAETEGGYSAEIRVDHSYDSVFVPEGGTCFGLDIWVNDNDPDKPGSRTLAVTWSDTSDSSWKDASKMGTVQLDAAPATEKPTEIPATAVPTEAPTDIPATNVPVTEIPATDVPATDNSTAPSEGKGLSTGAIIGIAAGAIVVAAAIILAIVLSKKKKQ